MSCFSFMSGYVGHEKDAHDGLGIFFLAWAMFSLWMTISAHRTTFVLVVFLLFVFVQFLLLSISEFTATTFESISIRTQEAGGCFGVMAAFFAWYAAYAALLSKKQSLFGLPAGDLNAVYKSWGWGNDEKTN
jgi:succinate-acetate transporter protein